jgi:hypothetical protein
MEESGRLLAGVEEGMRQRVGEAIQQLAEGGMSLE